MSSNNDISEEMYRGFDRWHLNHLPPIANERNHTILFEYPFSNDQSQPPKPSIAEQKWDSNHVQLPSASQNELKFNNSVRQISTFIGH